MKDLNDEWLNQDGAIGDGGNDAAVQEEAEFEEGGKETSKIRWIIDISNNFIMVYN